MNKKMKTLPLLILLNTIGFAAFAQSTYYGLNVGYGSHIPGTTYVTNYNNQSETFSSNFDFYDVQNDFRERVNASYGSGLNVGVVIGKMFNPNLGVELGASYLLGKSIENSDFTKYSNYYSSNGSSYNLSSESIYESNYSKSVSMYKIMPTVIFSAGYEGLSPYAKLGAVIGNGSLTSVDEGTDISSDFNAGIFSSENYKIVEEYSGGFALGFGTALGVSYTMNAATSIYVEGYFESFNYSPKRREMTEYTINGSNTLDSLSVSQKEYEYVDEISSTGSSSQNENEPTKLLRIVYPMTTAALRFGVNFHF
jgi:hypothetical protein